MTMSFDGLRVIFSGVCHADELIYLFPSARVFRNISATLEDEQMTDCLIDMWTNFARTG
jgi:carboxylesterase type B